MKTIKSGGKSKTKVGTMEFMGKMDKCGHRATVMMDTQHHDG
jgi:hypothetical protein